jgi:methylenetetrahydrofolate reductase (NADPH)
MTEPRSHLEAVLRSGAFAVTAELGTTDSALAGSVLEAAAPLAGKVDAVNCTDNSAAHPHISQQAAAHLLVDEGFEPIVQFVCRDRNRLALQADILGACALGARNIMALTGDDVSAGDHPEAKPTYDLDSMHLLRIARIMRDQGTYLSGRPLTDPPSFFLGAVENPFAPPVDYRPIRLGKKVEAGAEFVQTQMIFNVPRMREFMKHVVDMGLHERVFVLGGICIPKSARGAHYMAENVPGTDLPQELLDRLDGVPKERQAAESVQIGLEILEELRSMEGVAGVHLMGVRNEEGIVAVIEGAGLLPRPASATA